jgi:hypothetical protein
MTSKIEVNSCPVNQSIESKKSQRPDNQITLEPTVFNQTDDHIIDSNMEISPSQIYDKHIKSTLSKEETKDHIDKLIAAKEETSIEKIKRKYLKNDISIGNRDVKDADKRIKSVSSKKETIKAATESCSTNNIPSKTLTKKPSITQIKKPQGKSSRQNSISSKSTRRLPSAKGKAKMVTKPTKCVSIKGMGTPNSKLINNGPSKKSISDLFTLIRMHAQNCTDMKCMLEANGFSV